MNLQILQDKKESNLKRTIYFVKISWEQALPSRKEIREKFLALKQTNPKTTLVKKIHTKFKKREALVEIVCYEDEALMKQLEPKRFLEVNGLIEVKQ
ncbi:MAG: hypothetical protein QW524_02910 [Candidatus Woesearchaeota archaeon]